MPTQVLKLLSAAVPESSDADLITRFVTSRDEQAFTELVRRHGPSVYRICRRMAGSAHADDAFQSTLLVLACRAQSLRKSGSVGSWLIGIAGRVSRQMRRREVRLATRHRERAGESPEHSTPARSSLECSELAAVLDDELTRLPDALRGPVVLCLVEGRTQEQAAAALGGSVRTLRRRLDQARLLLRLRLERRGVVPVVAVGLVASVGESSVAVPPELARRAVAGVFEFLAAGGAVSTPAAIVAKGVAGSMVRFKVSALMAATAAVLIAIGIVGAGDRPGDAAPPNGPAAQAAADPPGRPSPPALATPAGAIPPRPIQPPPGGQGPSATHHAANFVVAAPTAVMARAIAAEAEFQRREQAKRWLGKELPNWSKPCSIRVTSAANESGGGTTFAFPWNGGSEPPSTFWAEMQLHGSFLDVLTNLLPQEVTRTVMATHFRGAIPRWADAGIAVTAESEEGQAAHDAWLREVLETGRGVRLRVLFRGRELPGDTRIAHAQGHSVVRFLLTRQPDLRHVVFEGGSVGKLERPALNAPGQSEPHQGVLTFLMIAGGGRWDMAAKDVYGFESVDKLEAAWLNWLKTPESQLKAPPGSRSDFNNDKADRIPPTRLSGATRQTDSPAPRAVPPADRSALPPPDADLTLPRPQLVPPAVPARQPQPPAAAASVRTDHFVVNAPTADQARQIGAAAERHRKELARAWLGKELPDWPDLCPIKVTPTDASSGASVFTFRPADKAPPGVASISMELRGPFRQILTSILPHEVLHTILATHFGKPLPRWADEGIAVTAESAEEQTNHDVKLRELLNAGRVIRLKTLFRMNDYPRDMIVTFAQGHSVVRFLLAYSNRDGLPVLSDIPYLKDLFTVVGPSGHRQRLLAFLTVGMDGNTADSWDKAAKDVYGFESVDKLEEAWLNWLKTPESQLKPKDAPRQKSSAPGDDKSDLIPPPNLSGVMPQSRPYNDWLPTQPGRTGPVSPALPSVPPLGPQAPQAPKDDRPDRIPPTELSGKEHPKMPPQRMELQKDQATGTDVVAFNSRRIVLPIEVKRLKRGVVQEAQLFVSQDEGKTWELEGTTSPDRGRFDFKAPSDGTYWFSTVMVFQDGSQEPKDLASMAPHLKILVDTTPPVVRLTEVRRTGDGVVLNWTVEDKCPNHAATRVQFKQAGTAGQAIDGVWQSVNLPAESPLGVRFNPEIMGPIEFRVIASDRAGNIGISAIHRLEAAGKPDR